MTIFKNQCFKCHSKNYLAVDHNRPLSSGSGLSIDNAVILCKFCNSKKYTKMPELFYSKKELNQLLELAKDMKLQKGILK